MSARDSILAAVLRNQPALSPLPDLSPFRGEDRDLIARYAEIFAGIGGQVFRVRDLTEINALARSRFDADRRFVTTLPELGEPFETLSATVDPHSFNDVELAVIEAELAVAENGAVWLPEHRMGQRIVPYICQHLGVVVRAEVIVPTLHEAYARIGAGQYGFGAFIGGPSKTADIEQALVLGAHGPITMTVFILEPTTVPTEPA
ncbi:LutC/YkgG family protein [Larkinella soli]|uniref:LutC/YkgG family protein n=1 Tax=Larkinella soli TaxID=1770527 RepID=UPI000FFC379C|nr:LUD domain-containing protein [Larkinella soli]